MVLFPFLRRFNDEFCLFSDTLSIKICDTVYKLDRFSRNKYEMAIHRKHLKDNGIKILSAMENIPDTPEGILLESLLEGYEHSNGHNKNQIWIETVYIRCKSKAEFAQNEFRFPIRSPTYTIQNILNATLYFRLKPLSL